MSKGEEKPRKNVWACDVCGANALCNDAVIIRNGKVLCPKCADKK